MQVIRIARFFAMVFAFLTIASQANATLVSAPFSEGFIGRYTNNAHQPTGILTFNTLGIARAFLQQDTINGQFGGTQGNDLTANLKLVFTDGRVINVPGAINWRDGANPLNGVGFIPDSTYTGSFTYGASQTYSMNGGAVSVADSKYSSFLVQLNTSAVTYTDGSSVGGNAALNATAWTALNNYLATTVSSRPAGPVAVTSQTTSDTTPTVSGTVTLQATEDLTVEINGVVYTTSNGLTLDRVAGTWSVTIPDGSALTAGTTYSVTATIVNQSGYVLADSTSSELVITALTASMRLTKTAVQSGSTITYSYVLVNTGDLAINTVAVAESAGGFTGTGTLPTPSIDAALTGTADDDSILGVGETWYYTATYTLTQADIDAGSVSNSATATGKNPSNVAVSDVSDNGNESTDGPDAGTDPTNDPTVTAITQSPAMVLTKTSSVSGSTVTYTYTVENTGNVTLNTVSISESAGGFTGTGTRPTPAEVKVGGFNTGDANSNNKLDVGETWNFTASYTLTQADKDSGSLSNSATATAKDPTNTTRTDVSDNGDEENDGPDSDTDPTNDPTVTSITQSPEVTLVKTASVTGRTATFSFALTNSGNVTLHDQTITETDFGGTGDDPVITAVTSGGYNTGDADSDNVFDVGETWAYTATYEMSDADILAGGVSNSATATAKDPDEGSVSDVSDDGNEAADGSDADVDPTNDPTLATITPDRTMSMTLSAALGASTVTYTYSITNDGNLTLNPPTIDQTACISAPCFTGTGPTLSAPSATLAGVNNTGDTNGDGMLSPGETWVYTATYTITDDDRTAGSITHQATASSTDTASTPVTDVSDGDGIVADGNTDSNFGNDPTITPLTPTPAISLVKSASQGAGVITYHFDLENTGNVAMDTVSVAETGFQGSGTTPVPAPILASGYNAGDTNSDDMFDPGEIWQFSASYTLVTADYDRGSVTNSATATAEYSGTPYTDLSDGDGGATDGDGDSDPGNDPTELTLTTNAEVTLVKTATAVDGTVSYSYALTNSGNVSLTDPSVDESVADFTGTGDLPTPLYDSGDTDTDNVLDVGETWIFVADYTPNATDLNAGQLTNSATATATPPNSAPDVTDVSDDDADPTNGDDTATVTDLVLTPGINLVKTATVTGTTIDYTYTVTNTGNVALASVSITESDDAFTGTDGAPAATYDSGDTDSDDLLDTDETWVFTGSYTASAADLAAGDITNSATVTGTDPQGNDVTDVSDDDNDPTNGDDTATVTDLPDADLTISHSLTTLTRLFPARYQAVYHLTLTNDGTFDLTDVSLINDLIAFLGAGNLFDDAVAVLDDGDCLLNTDFDGDSDTQLLDTGCTMAPGDSMAITITFEFDSSDGFPATDNMAEGSAAELATPVEDGEDLGVVDTDDDGGPDSDESDATDRDGDGVVDSEDYDPTGYFYCEEDGQILTGGSISISGPSGSNSSVGTANGITIVRDGSDGQYQWFVSAAGEYTMTLTYPASGDPSTDRLDAGVALDVTSLLPDDPAFIGSTEYGSSGALASFTLADNPTFYTVFNIEAGDPNVMANNIPMKNCATGGAGLDVTDIDLLATESDSETAKMGFVLQTEPTGPVTLTFAGDAQCSVTPETITFTPDNWDTMQMLTIIGRSDDVEEGSHTCTPTVVTSSSDPDYDGLSPTLSAVTLTDSLVEAVKDQVREKLVQDFKATLGERQSRMRDISAGAADRLALPVPLDCDSNRDRLPHGSIDAAGGDIRINGTLNDMGDACAVEDRRILQSEFALTRQADGQTAIDISVDLLRERRVSDYRIRGSFVGGYLRLPAGNSDGDRISGLGLQMGVYGADRRENGNVMDYYLALGIGRHDYRFGFGSVDPITATGHYGYVAGYAGVAWSRGREMGDLVITPRAGVDLAIGVPTNASILAEQGDLAETGSIDMPVIGLLRFYAEVKVAAIDEPAVYGKIDRDWWITPGLFCDVGFGDPLVDGQDCGLALDLGWRQTSADQTEDTEVVLEGEMSEGHERLGLTLRHVKRIADGNGKIETSLSLATSGDISAGEQFELRF